MGKNRHSKDKLYIVANEYARDWGGCKKSSTAAGQRLPFQCLPFDCCGLSLRPFTIPVCTTEGIVFDADKIFSYIDEYHRNPVTGAKLEKKDLIVLHFHKNHAGHYHCPITYKEFNEHSYIVANRKSGHVYSNDAIDAVCRKARTWVDFFTNEKFSSSDLITIQNPQDFTRRQVEEFDYIKTDKLVPTLRAAQEGSLVPVMRGSDLATSIIKESKAVEEERKEQHNKLIPNIHARRKKEREAQEDNTTSGLTTEQPKEKLKHRLYTTSGQASSFTSTAVEISYNAEFRDLTDREVRFLTYTEVKKRRLKGYVRLVTDLGVLNVELHCDKVPETCDNFLRHCKSGYYNETLFHRSIPNFMIQGGDPLGTGTGGESAFENGAPSPDEFHPHLVHKGPGILSMANSGKNTNKSQFFITYKSCEHLNNKHSVFGTLVGGSETLTKMEQLETHKDTDRPKHPPKILETVIFKNPFEDLLKEKEEAEIKAKEDEAKLILLGKTTHELLDPMQHHTKRDTLEPGKYIDTQALRVGLPESLKSPKAYSLVVPTESSRKRAALHEKSFGLLHAMKKSKLSTMGRNPDAPEW